VLVGAFPGGAEVDCLAFPTGGIPVDVPWVSEEPVSGTVAAGGTQDVGVMFTAQNPDGTPMPLGTYFATLNVKSNDSVAGTQLVEVIMHIVSEYLAPAPEFTSNTPVNVGDPMEFLNLSDAGIPPTTEYLWNFGDGITQTVGTTDPVIHLYGTYGTFTVSLTACNVVDCVTVTHDVVVLPKVFYLPIINKN
jgi:PKD repeat protein